MQTQTDFVNQNKHGVVQGYRTRARIVMYFKNEKCAEAFMRDYINAIDDNATP